MLKIINKDRIIGMNVGMTQFTDWYVKSIGEAVNWNLETKVQTPIYSIRIKHAITKNIIDIDLHREAVNKRYYRVVCIRDMKEHVELISKHALMYKSELLIRIKEVALDK